MVANVLVCARNRRQSSSAPRRCVRIGARRRRRRCATQELQREREAVSARQSRELAENERQQQVRAPRGGCAVAGDAVVGDARTDVPGARSC